MKNRTYQFGASSLTLQFGDITTSDAEALVSSDDDYISMGGGVSAAILRAGGQEILIDASKKVPARIGDVVVTTAGRLKAQYVFHAVTVSAATIGAGPDEILRNAVWRCFDLVDVLGLTSIAFPAIGAGTARFGYEQVAVQMADVVGRRLLNSSRSLRATLFLFDKTGRMESMDYIRFFEEFRARVPSVAGRESQSVPVVRQAAPGLVPGVPATTPGRNTLVELNDERTRLEDELVRILEAGDRQGEEQLRRRLNEIQEQRLRALAALRRTPSKVRIFISYAHEDRPLAEQLLRQLSILKRQGLIETWHDRVIVAGEDWKDQIDDRLESADLILLLISPDFLDSNYCYNIEMERALERNQAGDARVIPVILRPSMWSSAPFATLQALPRDANPVTRWDDRDSALLNVAEGVRDAVVSFMSRRNGAARGHAQ